MNHLADLPDSLRPRTVYLADMPAPRRVEVPENAGQTALLPIWRDESGEPILDPQGQPIILGDGGKSHFTNFTSDDGLALDAVSCSMLDRFGNIWFGTPGGGISRYDGKAFTTFTIAQGLARNSILDIIEDRAGNIWIATGGGGVSKYDGQSFVTYTTAQGLGHNFIYRMLEDSAGHIWFATKGGGVSKYDGQSFTTFTTDDGLANNVIISIAEDKAGHIWLGTKGGNITHYDGQRFRALPPTEGRPSTIVLDIAADRNGNIWFATGGGGVAKYDGQTFTTFTTAQGLGHNAVHSVLEDKNGHLWFGTFGGGVSRYDGRTFRTYTTGQELAANIIYCILEDKTGNLWFGTDGGGVSRYSGPAFTSFTTAQGLADNTIWSIAEDESGQLWFGTNGAGVSRFDGQSFRTFTYAQGLGDDVIYSIFKDKRGHLWFGTRGKGVSRYDGQTFQTFTTQQGLIENTVWSILEDEAGNIWLGTDGGGLSKFDGESFTNYKSASGMPAISSLCDSAGDLWFGTRGAGLLRFDGESFCTYTIAQGLANDLVFCIFEDKSGNIWLGTDDGLSVLPAGQGRQEREKLGSSSPKGQADGPLFRTFTTADGLADNFVTHVLQLPDGRMAVGTNLGITLFNTADNCTRLTDIASYNSQTGYPVKDVNVGQNCMFLDSQGTIWAGTGSNKTGLVRFDVAALPDNKLPPAVVIQSIRIENEPICWHQLPPKGKNEYRRDSSTILFQAYLAYNKTLSAAQKDSMVSRFGDIQFDGITPFYPLPENLVLPYEHNQISFEFAAIDTYKPFLVNYQYKLDGYDRGWSPISNRSSASFGNIHEGTYTFVLKAQAANGTWTAPVTYTFRVLPPWYRTWWAYTIYVALFVLSIGVFSKWRERTLKAEKEKLERTVEERTEELVQQNIIVEKEKKRSDELLLNILPEEVAEELKAKGSAEAKYYDEVTVLFTDFIDFTQLSEKLVPKDLVAEINACFSAFDLIMQRHGVEKIKTVGDAYMAVGGLPTANATHATDVVNAALDIQAFMRDHKANKRSAGEPFFEVRIGAHTGPVVAGIVGIKKFQYDIWGDTVNTASRMESSAEAGKINISGTTYALVSTAFACTYRGKVQAKGKGEIDMYFVEGRS